MLACVPVEVSTWLVPSYSMWLITFFFQCLSLHTVSNYLCYLSLQELTMISDTVEGAVDHSTVSAQVGWCCGRINKKLNVTAERHQRTANMLISTSDFSAFYEFVCYLIFGIPMSQKWATVLVHGVPHFAYCWKKPLKQYYMSMTVIQASLKSSNNVKAHPWV